MLFKFEILDEQCILTVFVYLLFVDEAISSGVLLNITGGIYCCVRPGLGTRQFSV